MELYEIKMMNMIKMVVAIDGDTIYYKTFMIDFKEGFTGLTCGWSKMVQHNIDGTIAKNESEYLGTFDSLKDIENYYELDRILSN